MQRQEQFERIFGVRFSCASFDILSNFLLSFLPVTGKAKEVFLVRPKNRLALLDIYACKDVMQVDDDIFGSIADNNEEASLFLLICLSLSRLYCLSPKATYLHTISYEIRDPRINGFSRHGARDERPQA